MTDNILATRATRTRIAEYALGVQVNSALALTHRSARSVRSHRVCSRGLGLLCSCDGARERGGIGIRRLWVFGERRKAVPEHGIALFA